MAEFLRQESTSSNSMGIKVYSVLDYQEFQDSNHCMCITFTFNGFSNQDTGNMFIDLYLRHNVVIFMEMTLGKNNHWDSGTKDGRRVSTCFTY